MNNKQVTNIQVHWQKQPSSFSFTASKFHPTYWFITHFQWDEHFLWWILQQKDSLVEAVNLQSPHHAVEHETQIVERVWLLYQQERVNVPYTKVDTALSTGRGFPLFLLFFLRGTGNVAKCLGYFTNQVARSITVREYNHRINTEYHWTGTNLNVQ